DAPRIRRSPKKNSGEGHFALASSKLGRWRLHSVMATPRWRPFLWRRFHARGGAMRKQREEHQRTIGKKVWLVTGAGRGMGVDIAKAALAADHAVVATGRDTKAVEKAVGKSNDLLVVKLDVTRLADAEAASRAAVDRFGRIDVLVNNAGNFFAGFFEELSPEDIEKQLAANLIGPMNVTRAVLPVMRKQRSGHIITKIGRASCRGIEFCSAYAAAKFGVEGWTESLQAEIAP